MTYYAIRADAQSPYTEQDVVAQADSYLACSDAARVATGWVVTGHDAPGTAPYFIINWCPWQ